MAGVWAAGAFSVLRPGSCAAAEELAGGVVFTPVVPVTFVPEGRVVGGGAATRSPAVRAASPKSPTSIRAKALLNTFASCPRRLKSWWYLAFQVFWKLAIAAWSFSALGPGAAAGLSSPLTRARSGQENWLRSWSKRSGRVASSTTVAISLRTARSSAAERLVDGGAAGAGGVSSAAAGWAVIGRHAKPSSENDAMRGALRMPCSFGYDPSKGSK